MIPVANLCGQDLAYWVARANATTSREARNILRRHYGSGPSRRSLHEEVAMREFVAGKLGHVVPDRCLWP